MSEGKTRIRRKKRSIRGYEKYKLFDVTKFILSLPTCATKKHRLKWMSYNQMNQSYGLSYIKTLLHSSQKVPEVKIACCYSNKDDLYWLEDYWLKWRYLQNQTSDCKIKDTL